jgi:GNAT superfamily N-acetyltransferase
MAWRLPRRANNWQEAKGEKNKAALHGLLAEGKLYAMLALAGETPVGWCSFGPRGSFPHLVQTRALKTGWTESTWSITCFYIYRHWRNRGVAGRLLAAATDEAFALGANEVEGYPVVPSKLPSPIPAAFAWTGVPSLFENAGYAAIPRPGSARPIYVKKRPSGR